MDWAKPITQGSPLSQTVEHGQTGRGPTSKIKVSGPNFRRIVTSDIEMMNIHRLLWFFIRFSTTIDGVHQ
jgi:hypothetical protein